MDGTQEVEASNEEDDGYEVVICMPLIDGERACDGDIEDETDVDILNVCRWPACETDGKLEDEDNADGEDCRLPHAELTIGRLTAAAGVFSDEDLAPVEV